MGMQSAKREYDQAASEHSGVPIPLVRLPAARKCVAFLIALALGMGCNPPPEPDSEPRPIHTRFDSLTEAQAAMHSHEWREIHFATTDLHGPFPRPALPQGADTNDAAAYYRLGDSVMYREQGLADRAFYWAVRLDPTMAEAYYARWELRYHGRVHRLYPDDSVRRIPRPTPNEEAALDSLRLSAFMYNPFLDGALDIPPQIRTLSERQADRDARTAGLLAYVRGDYRKAVKKWGEAIRKRPENAPFHFPRAYAWVHLGERDSAVADLTALINRIERIEDSTVTPYLSKAFLYYAIGLLRGEQQRFPEARAAYESALLENLGFYMAHLRLSVVALHLHDTTTALTELETGTLMRGDDPVLHTLQGGILDGAKRFNEAEHELLAAIHVDTDYAPPYAYLGHIAEQRHDTTRALSAYHEYVARASHTASDRTWVLPHMAQLNPGVKQR